MTPSRVDSTIATNHPCEHTQSADAMTVSCNQQIQMLVNPLTLSRTFISPDYTHVDVLITGVTRESRLDYLRTRAD